jgi:NAD+ diphosphatase
MARAPFIHGVELPDEGAGAELWFAVTGSDVLVLEEGESARMPDSAAALGVEATDRHYLGRLDGRDCFADEVVDAASLPAGLTTSDLRRLFGRVPDEVFAIAGKAVQIVDWDRTHRFCGRCGAPTERVAGERARRCAACGHSAYPRLAPAVITVVERGDEILLARGTRFPLPFYSALAGFVEPGESLEEAVAREIYEEVGVDVSDVTYFGSQPWPFPHSLMIGFTAQYAGGDIRLDEAEIVDAQFFAKDELPLVPPPISIARWLIDAVAARR